MHRDWKRLAERVRQRRGELGVSQQALARRGPLSRDRVQKIESALRDSYSPLVLAALERALGWRAGSVDAVLGGGEPSDQTAGDLPGVREHPLPAELADRLGVEAGDYQTLELTVPGEEGVLIVTWSGELPTDLRAVLEDVRAQSRLLERRAQVEREDRDRDHRDGTNG